MYVQSHYYFHILISLVSSGALANTPSPPDRLAEESDFF